MANGSPNVAIDESLFDLLTFSTKVPLPMVLNRNGVSKKRATNFSILIVARGASTTNQLLQECYLTCLNATQINDTNAFSMIKSLLYLPPIIQTLSHI